MTNSTANDTVKANPFKEASPTSRMPSIETMTTRPANTTARPAVAIAPTVAASRLLSLGEAAAEPGDDEQRVVDADAEPDHRRSGRSPIRDVDDPAQDLTERESGAEAEHGGDQWKPHRHRRPEDEQQDDGRRDQPDAFGSERGGLRQRCDRAADLDLEGVVAGGEDGFDQGFGLLGGEVAVTLVQGDLGVRRRAVVRDLRRTAVGERAGDGHHVVALGDVGEDRLCP